MDILRGLKFDVYFECDKKAKGFSKEIKKKEKVKPLHKVFKWDNNTKWKKSNNFIV